MIEHGHTILTDDIAEEHFVCDLIKCKGACCVEGDLGAPLEQEELSLIDEALEAVMPYLPEASQKILNEEGPYLLDEDGDFSTTTNGGRECVFAVYDKNGILKCGIEQAWADGKTSFRKPVSCHLYPIRLKKYEQFIAVNYDRWDICAPACEKGASLKVPLYRFLKEPLIRRFGNEWYEKLVALIERPRNENS